MSSAPYASRPTMTRHDKEPGSGALVAVVAVMLGILVGVLGIFALLMWIDARNPQRRQQLELHGGHAGNDDDSDRHRRHDELRRRSAGQRGRTRHRPQGRTRRRSPPWPPARSPTSISC